MTKQEPKDVQRHEVFEVQAFFIQIGDSEGNYMA